MGRPLEDALLAAATAASGADTVIAELARGFDTLLARQFKDGAELSGGQWQRIAAARGFYRTAPLLITDEPTAALDARALHQIFGAVSASVVADRGRRPILVTERMNGVLSWGFA